MRRCVSSSRAPTGSRLNRIFDSKPSEIAGKITAKGQVWLQNSNGIIFKDGAQINAHSILATALPITENQLYNGLLSGNGVIRGQAANPLFSRPEYRHGARARRSDSILNSLLGEAPAPVAGERTSVIDFLARAAIRIAILRENGMEGVDQYNSGYGLDTLSYYDASAGGTRYFINPEFANVGLRRGASKASSPNIDVSKMGDYDYSDFTNISQFWTGVSWQGIPAGSPIDPPGCCATKWRRRSGPSSSISTARALRRRSRTIPITSPIRVSRSNAARP